MNLKLVLTCLLACQAADAASAKCPAVDPAIQVKSYSLDAIQKSLDATKKFIDIFKADIFESTGVKQLAGIIGVMLPISSAIINLIRGPGSSEVTQMQLEFARVNEKLDKIDLKLDEVMDLIDWSSTTVMYADLETTINTASERFSSYVLNPTESSKSRFMASFGSDPDAPLKLYLAIVDDTTVIAKNLATAAVKYTKGHRRQVMNFLLNVQRLIVRGAQLEIAYDKFRCGDAAGQEVEELWQGYVEKLIVRMKDVETEVMQGYLDQLSSDLSTQAAKFSHLSHGDFAVRLQAFLTDKYDWRRWIVLAYNPVSGGDHHWFSYCGGRTLFRFNNKRNIVAVSANPKNSQFTPQKGDAALMAAQSEGFSRLRTAEEWTTLIRNKVGGCHNAALVASVCWNCGFQYAWADGYRSYLKLVSFMKPPAPPGALTHYHTVVFG